MPDAARKVRLKCAALTKPQRDAPAWAWRRSGTYWSHNTPSQYELLAQTLAMLHLGFPKDQLPATGA